LSTGRFTVIVIALGAVAITALLVANGGRPFGGEDVRGTDARALTRADTPRVR
jgi:hypothetical protein